MPCRSAFTTQQSAAYAMKCIGPSPCHTKTEPSPRLKNSAGAGRNARCKKRLGAASAVQDIAVAQSAGDRSSVKRLWAARTCSDLSPATNNGVRSAHRPPHVNSTATPCTLEPELLQPGPTHLPDSQLGNAAGVGEQPTYLQEACPNSKTPPRAHRVHTVCIQILQIYFTRTRTHRSTSHKAPGEALSNVCNFAVKTRIQSRATTADE